MPKSTSSLGIIEFGRQLIETGDLDPLYIALYNARLPRPVLCRWLLAHWCYYHAGLACWVVTQPDFYKALMAVAKGGTRHPRGSERRHFRGNTAITAVGKLEKQFSDASSVVDWMLEAGPRADSIMKRVKTLYGFGEWISGKVPDMLERLGLGRVDFVVEDVNLMFDSPKKGALEVFSRYAAEINGDVFQRLLWAHHYLLRHLARAKSGLRAPPKYERPINIQETETIFCKWKSHLSGHYPVGKDTHEIRHGLLRYKECPISLVLLKHLPTLEENHA